MHAAFTTALRELAATGTSRLRLLTPDGPACDCPGYTAQAFVFLR